MWNENVLAKYFGRRTILTGGELWKRILLVAPLLLPLAAQSQGGPSVVLPDHVPAILAHATPLPRTPQMDQDPVTVCVMLNLSDQAGFDAAEADFNNPDSPAYHKPINANDLTARFGPTQQAYDTVLAYLQQNGFKLAVGSANRRTITVRGTRAQMEAAFNVQLNDYVLGSTTFHSNATDPSIPQSVAPLIRSIVGLSNLYQPKPANAPVPNSPMAHATAYDGALTPAGKTNSGGLPPGLNGAGQSIGLIEYDNYDDSDVAAWLSLVGLPPKMIDHVSRFSIDGGRTASNGGGTTEVLLDIDAALGIAQGSNIIVFVTPYGTDTLTTINAAIDQMNVMTGGVGGILSSSWGSTCELAISKSEAQSLDSALQTAALSGITLFVDSADGGAFCVGGVPSGESTTGVHYPSDSPHAVAVGGTTLSYGADSVYGGETWWDSSSKVGGSFGVSTYFGRPGYQTPFTSASGRSVPDISADAGSGIVMCQASVSSSCFQEGGTSLATPIWASVWAIASQGLADAGLPIVSASGDYFYKISTAFHSASTMTGPGNDFAHVGLGSPYIDKVAAMAVADALKVESISPSSGPGGGGTTVTITGKGFIGVEKVTFGGVEATNVTVYSDSKLTADSPAAPADSVDIQVVTPGGVTAKSAKDVFSYAPEVTKVSPDSGPLTGGTTVTVTGHGFNTSSTSFDFGWAPATKVSCSSSTECTMVNPSSIATTLQVTAKTSLGTSPLNKDDDFTYVLNVTKVSPNSGPLVGGITVTVTGQGLTDKLKFDFGSSPATSVVCASLTSCTMTAPAHSAGTVDVIVETSLGNSPTTSADHFTYQAPAITGVSPSVGPTVGGETVNITGVGFDSTMTVKFGGVAAKMDLCTSDSSCSVESPSGTGSVHVTATLAGVTSTQTSADLYTYAVFPSVVTLSTNNAPVAGGIPVTVTGTNFSTAPGGTTIQFGTLPGTGVTCSSSTQCAVTAPVRDSSAGFLSAPVTATVNGHTSLQYVPFFFGTPPPPPPPPPCKGTACQ